MQTQAKSGPIRTLNNGSVEDLFFSVPFPASQTTDLTTQINIYSTEIIYPPRHPILRVISVRRMLEAMGPDAWLV